MTPKPRIPEAALRAGTVNQIDRSAQYSLHEAASAPALLRSQNHQWAELRKMQGRELRNHLIVIVVAALLAWLPGIVKWIAQ